MSDAFDIYTVIFLVLAVFIFLRLRSVLGQRTGEERPPVDPYSRREQASANENVVPLPTRNPEAAKPEPVAPEKRWEGVAEPGTPLASGLDEIHAADPSFDANMFLQGARGAYEMIVSAFADGDTKTLKGLLAKDVYENFAAAIAERDRNGETVESTFVSIDKVQLREAELRNRTAQLVVEFQSELVTATRDRDGNVIAGNPDKVSELVDVWTFARETTARDPNWKLVATGEA